MTKEEKARESKRKSNAKYRAANLEKARERKRKYRADNPEKVRESKRKSNAKYRADNPEKERESKRKSNAKYSADNPDKLRERNRKRRARKYGCTEHFTTPQFNLIKLIHGNQCILCHRSEAELNALGLRLVGDHIKALDNDGTDDCDNLQPLCHGKGGCNNKKHVQYTDYRPWLTRIYPIRYMAETQTVEQQVSAQQVVTEQVSALLQEVIAA